MPGPVVVLGATGRIGRALRRVWETDSAGTETVWVGRRFAQGIDTVVDPLRDASGLRSVLDGAGLVLCLAGPIPGPGADMDDHRRIAESVLAARGSTPVLLMSSAAVYGRTPPPLTEDRMVTPETAYGFAKLAMEAAAAGQPGITCLRLGNVAGADRLLGGPDPVRLDTWPDGASPVRSYIGPVTLARALAALCTLPGPLPPILNLAAPRPVSMAALLDAAGMSWQPVPAPATAIREVVLDTTRLERVFAFAPEASDPATMIAEWRQMRDVWE